jgi:uncharacterized membrane protein
MVHCTYLMWRIGFTMIEYSPINQDYSCIMSTHETIHSQPVPDTITPVGLLVRSDIRLILGGALLLLLVIGLEPWLWFLAPIRLVLGFFYIFYVPGYCLQVALFPRQSDIDGIERVGLSLGLSIASLPVLMLLLDRLPWGLAFWAVVTGHLIMVVIFCGVASLRRLRVPAEERFAPRPRLQPRSWWQSLAPLEKRIYPVLAGLVMLLLGAFLWVFAVPASTDFMTEFYVLGAEELGEDYPRTPMVGEEIDVTMGIVNRELETETYHVEVWVTWAWEPDAWWTLVQETDPLTLEPGEETEQVVTWTMPWEAEDAQVYFRLYREDDTEPYRELLIWMDVLPDPERDDMIEPRIVGP